MADDGKEPADRYPDSEGPFAGPNNTFPLTDAGRVKNAWARIHQGPTMANHTPAEIADIKAKILARAKELGITLEEHNADSGDRAAPPANIERRTTIIRVELRTAEDGAPGRRIGGYAAVFNKDSRRLGTFVERIVPSFFDQEYRSGWPGQGAGVVARYNHEPNFLLGSTRSGTLQLRLDGTGLDYSVDVPETRADVYELASRGDLNGSSFAFAVDPDGYEWSHNDLGVTQRTLLQGRLIDVAPVSEPAAYPDATVALRSLAHFKEIPEEDVFVLARADDLRKLFVRTDTQLAPPAPVPEPEPEHAEPAQLELPLQPPTLSHREAKLWLLAHRPHDPIVA